MMENATIAFLDVLGWQGIWQRRKDPISGLLNLVESAKQKHTELKNDKADNLYVKKFRGAHMDVFLISDTIVVVSKDEIEHGLTYLSFVCSHIVSAGLALGYPIRGAIAHGELGYTSNTLYGPAVDEVASWYESADWIGVHLCPSAYLPIHGKKIPFLNIMSVVYDVPIKGGTPYGIQCLNWPFVWDPSNMDYVKRRKNLVAALLTQAPMIPTVGQKVANTLKYYDSQLPSVIKLDAFLAGKAGPPEGLGF